MQYPRPIVVVSQCLEFEPVRYNGQMIPDPVVRKLNKHVDFRPVCPEVAIGLGVPRDPVRLVVVEGEKRMIQPTTGLDATDSMQSYGDDFLDSLPAVDGFILKFKSPSCGIKEVKLYASAEKGSGAGKGSGLFAERVMQRYADLPVEDEGRLRNFQIREQFFTRIFAIAALRRVVASGRMGDLVKFHAAHKYLLMAWNQKALRELGPVVANHGKRPVPDVLADYQGRFTVALNRTPAKGAHINVLTHCFGYVSDQLASDEKGFFMDTLASYQQGKVPLSVPLHIMRAWIIRFDVGYLKDQRYFSPYPEDLVEIADSGKGRDLN